MAHGFIALIFTTLFLTTGALALSSHAREANTTVDPGRSADSTPDSRISLDLPPAARETVKLTMREHLEALQAIVSALGREDFEKAATVAHEDLGFPKHHQAMQREQGATFPPKYQELAMAHHQAAEDLAKVIATKEMKLILEKLDQTMESCVACHQAYKL